MVRLRSFQWPYAVMFCVTFIVLAGLVYTGRLHPEALMVQLAWLAPSPLTTDERKKSRSSMVPPPPPSTP